MALELDDDLRTPGDELRRDGDWMPQNEPTRAKALWLVAALLVVAAGAAVYILYGDREPATPAPVVETAPAAPPAATAAPSTTLGGEPYPVDVPSLDLTDPLVRELLTKLSGHPRIAAWLATEGLVRSFTVVVLNVSEGKLPANAKGLTALRPTARFRVVERGGQTYLDPQSFDRYNALADGVGSVDAAGSARLYATLRPRLEEAHRDLGASTASFDVAVERAIVRLLETPAVTDARAGRTDARGHRLRLRRPAAGVVERCPETAPADGATQRPPDSGEAARNRAGTGHPGVALAAGWPRGSACDRQELSALAARTG